MTSARNARKSYAAERLFMKLAFNTMYDPPTRLEAVNKLEGFIFPGD